MTSSPIRFVPSQFSQFLPISFVAALVLLSAPSAWSQDADRAAPPASESNPFQNPPDTQPAPEGVTSAAAALKAMQVPPGFRASLFASEPTLRQPIAMASDQRGRLWVAENYSYAQSGVNFDLKLRDRIVVLEDRDQDGQAERRTVFWDQASRLTSVEVGWGGVWALCPPQLLFIPDRNEDDVPDGPPEVVLDGWDDDAVRHNIANGLRWGPDGWLYGRHGILATSTVGTPGTPAALRKRINCGVWRYHPVRRDFEVVCQGTTNPWGMDWDEHGQLFFINTVIGHLWHVLPGSHLQRMYGEDLTPHVYDLIPQTADHFHWDTAEVWSDIRTIGVSPTTDQAGGGHAHSGMAIYQGGSWPRRYHNTVFAVNLHGRRLNNDRLARRGATYVATHEPDFARTTDPWFRGVELLVGQHGEMYIADWSDIGECHENDGVHRSSGRIFQLQYVGERDEEPAHGIEAAERNGAPADAPSLREATDAYLVAAQMRKNEWLVRQARQILHERAVAGRDMSRVHSELRRLFETEKADTRQLRALWSLFLTGGASDDWLVQQLQHPSEQVRAWVVQLLVDSGEASPAAIAAFRQRAEHDDSGLVLAYLASALQRMPLDARLPLATLLAARSQWANDPVYPLMVWYGLEPAVTAHPEAAAVLIEGSAPSKVREFVARRLTLEIERQPAVVARLVAALAKLNETEAKLDIARGMSQALRGWRRAPQPAGWPAVATQLADSSNAELVSLSRELSVVFGDGRALEELRVIAESGKADLESRRAALRTLVSAKVDGVAGLLQRLLGERDLQVDAIRGLSAFHDPKTPQLLVERFRNLHAAGQREAINTLVSRVPFAKVLVAAVAEGRLPREVVSPFHVRQMATLGDEHVTQLVATLWPELQLQTAEKAKRIAQFRAQLTTENLAAGDPSQGRATFHRVCANCHILFGQGAKVGPDLTGAQRGNLNYLLENIVDPSATVSENFRMSIVLTADGRVINGVLAEKTDRTITIATPTERIVLANDEIEEIRPSNLSIMPEGQLDVLSPEQTRDLIAYLMSPAQVPLPK